MDLELELSIIVVINRVYTRSFLCRSTDLLNIFINLEFVYSKAQTLNSLISIESCRVATQILNLTVRLLL